MSMWEVAAIAGIVYAVFVLAELTSINVRLNRMARIMATTQEVIDGLRAEAQEQTDAVAGLEVVVRTLIQTVRDAADDPEELADVLNRFEANTNSLIALALEGTPSEPGPTPEPEPTPEASASTQSRKTSK